jgi:cytosine deaminase
MLAVAFAEAQAGFDEGGVPVGAALFDADGNLLGRGRNRRVQDNDPSIHGETDAFRNAGRQINYRDKILVTTLAPCWYCSGLIRQFNIGTVVVGESTNFEGHLDWLKDAGVKIIELDDAACTALMRRFIEQSPQLWFEDIGECHCD